MGLVTTYLAPTTPSQPVDGGNKHFVIKAILDCTDTSCATGDTPEVIAIKEGWFVKRVWFRLIELATAASVLDCIGDSDGANTWITTDCNVGSTGTINTVLGSVHATDTNDALVGKLYLKDDYIYCTFKTQAYDGKMEIAAEVVNVFGGNTIV